MRDLIACNSFRVSTPDPLDEQICLALYSASRAVTGLYRPALSKLGLTYPQYLVLLALWNDDGLTVSELGAQIHLDSGTLSPLLSRLERQDLVRRVRDDTDARRVTVHLTNAGDAMRREYDGIRRCLGDGLAGVELTAEELVTLRNLARRVASAGQTQFTNPTPQGEHR